MRIHQIYDLAARVSQNKGQLLKDKTRLVMLAFLVAEFELKTLISGKELIHPTEQSTLNYISDVLTRSPSRLAQAKKDLTEIWSQIGKNGISAVNLPPVANPVSKHAGDNMALGKDEIQFLLGSGALMLDYLPEGFDIGSLQADFLPILEAGLAAEQNLALYENAQEDDYARLAVDSNTSEDDLNNAAVHSRQPEILSNIFKHQKATLDTYYILAANEETDAGILALIANDPQASKDKSIMQSVAYNPNTDEATLESIANNPAVNDDENILLSIAFAFNPTANEATLASLVANPHTPAAALHVIATRGPNHDAQIAVHANTQLVDLTQIAKRTNDSAVLNAIARKDYYRYSDEERNSCFLAVAQNTQTLTDDLTFIAQNTGDEDVLVAIARHNNANKNTLIAVVRANGDEDVLREVLTKDQADADVLKKIAGSVETFDEVIANNPKTLADDLGMIARRTHQISILEAIVKNNNVDKYGLMEVAANNNVSAEVLHLVTEHPIKSDDIDRDVVDSKQTLAADLTAIAGRTGETNILENIAKHANADKDTLLAVLNNANVIKGVLQDVAARDQADADVLHQIVEHAIVKSKTLDEELAGNAKTATADLITLANRAAKPEILSEIAGNPNADVDTLNAVLGNANVDDDVRRAVAGNGNANLAMLKAIFARSTVADAELAGNENMEAADLAVIAGRATDVAILISITQNTSANDLTLTAAVNNGWADDVMLAHIAGHQNANDAILHDITNRNVGPATDAAVAAHENTNAIDLDAIAHRSRRVDVATFLSIAKHTHAAPETLKYIAKANLGADIDDAVAAHPNAQAKSLEPIAKRTHNLATLRSIVEHANVNETILNDVVDLVNKNVPVDDALDAYIAQHLKAGVWALGEIANRTNNPETLTVITARNDTIDSTIADNPATRPSDLAIIAARCTDPAILAVITNRNVVAADSAVVRNENTDLTELTTIANRSEDLQVLNDILAHTVHGHEEALIADVLKQSEIVRQKQAEIEAQRQAALLTFSYKPLAHRPVAHQVQAVMEKPAAFNELTVEQQTVVITQLPPPQQQAAKKANFSHRF